MLGLHLTADLRGCAAAQPLMTEPATLRAFCLQAVATAGLTAVGELFHAFPPPAEQGAGGITGMVLLAESHLAVHTWPELGAVTLDVYVCNLQEDNSARAAALLAALEAGFAPARSEHQRVQRGGPG
jgi:S-adenosylmethionine decarboxylase